MNTQQMQAINEIQDLVDEAMELLEEWDLIGALEVFWDNDPADYIHLFM